MTQANAVRSSRKHRSSSLSRCRKRQAGRHPSILHHATAIGRDAEAPYYHATLGKDSLRYVAKRANSALGATERNQSQVVKRETINALGRLAILPPYRDTLSSSLNEREQPAGGEREMPLRQTCSEEYLRAQYAFKVLMIH